MAWFRFKFNPVPDNSPIIEERELAGSRTPYSILPMSLFILIRIPLHHITDEVITDQRNDFYTTRFVYLLFMHDSLLQNHSLPSLSFLASLISQFSSFSFPCLGSFNSLCCLSTFFVSPIFHFTCKCKKCIDIYMYTDGNGIYNIERTIIQCTVVSDLQTLNLSPTNKNVDNS